MDQTYFEKTVSASELSNNSGESLTAAERGPVGVTKHGKPKYVILSYDRYQKLKNAGDTRKAYTAETMPKEMMDAMLKAMKEHVDHPDDETPQS